MAILTIMYGGELLNFRIWLLIWQDLRTLSLQADSPYDNYYGCVIYVYAEKVTELKLAWQA